ncbi:MAG: M48 family metalloprotease [Balneolaceae bacterium]
MKRTIQHSLFALLIVFSTTACVIQKNPVSGSNRAFGYSWNQEKEIGREADSEISAQYGLYENEEVEEYVIAVGEKVLAESHMRRPDTESQFRETEFFFRVLDSPVINAFALPGGYVYMTRGLMVHLNNEAQFAVVMGHEIGHVAARHASQRALRQTIGQLAVVGGAVLGQEVLGLPGGTLLNLSSQAAQLLFLSYSRDAERESDGLGVEYSAMNGYVSAEGAAFFTSLKRISNQNQQSIPSFLSSHPDPGEREATIPELARVWQERGYEQTILNEDQYMSVINGMMYGENPREGFEREGVFYHPDLEFQFNIPSGWSLVNQPSQVVLLGPGEEAVSIMRIDSESSSPQQSVQRVLDSEEIEVNEQGPVTGSSASYAATATASLEDGTTVKLYIRALTFGERVYLFLSYTEQSRFDNYMEPFRQIPSSFERLTDPQILATQPVRIRVFRAQRSGPFSTFLPENLPMEIQPIDIAILNQVEIDEMIQEGEWIKMPVQD